MDLQTIGGLIDTSLPLNYITFRTRIQSTISGNQIKLTLSNKYGTKPLVINSMTVAKGYKDSTRTIKCSTKKTVTYQGKKTITIPAGQTIETDSIDLQVNAFEYVTTSMYIKDLSAVKTMGLIGGDTYTNSLNKVNCSTFLGGIHLKLSGDFGDYNVIPVLTGLKVSNNNAKAIVMIGDSTIANDVSLLLARKLNSQGTYNVSVLQQAIKGNRLLYAGAGKLGNLYGDSIESRFFEDAINQPGCEYIIVKVGMNDIIHPNCKSLKGLAPVSSTDEIIAGYERLIKQAHNNGKKIYFCTRTAWKGYTRNILGSGNDVEWTEGLEQMRIDLNNWVFNNQSADGYIDLSGLNDYQDPAKLKSKYTTDGVHLTKEGQKALVDLIDVSKLLKE